MSYRPPPPRPPPPQSLTPAPPFPPAKTSPRPKIAEGAAGHGAPEMVAPRFGRLDRRQSRWRARHTACPSIMESYRERRGRRPASPSWSIWRRGDQQRDGGRDSDDDRQGKPSSDCPVVEAHVIAGVRCGDGAPLSLVKNRRSLSPQLPTRCPRDPQPCGADLLPGLRGSSHAANTITQDRTRFETQPLDRFQSIVRSWPPGADGSTCISAPAARFRGRVGRDHQPRIDRDFDEACCQAAGPGAPTDG